MDFKTSNDFSKKERHSHEKFIIVTKSTTA